MSDQTGGPGSDTTRGAVILLLCLLLFPFAFSVIVDVVRFIVNR